MTLTLREHGPDCAAEVGGVDLSRPLSDRDFAALQAAIDRCGVRVFRGQRLDDAAQLAFSLRCGRPFDRTRFRRLMHRTTVAGDGPTVTSEAPSRPTASAAGRRSVHPLDGGRNGVCRAALQAARGAVPPASN